VLEKDTPLASFEKWAQSVRTEGKNQCKLIMQISHPGRQCPQSVNKSPVAPSAVPLKMPGGTFRPPRALTLDEIEEIIQRFVDTAVNAQKAGFDGIEVHSAHGYLSSQFLSPRSNLRTDKWGGSLENRMRFLRTIIQNIRSSVSSSFIVGVKINSTDFSRGGFDEKDSTLVIKMLEEEKVDFVEISGGNYEKGDLLKSVTQESAKTRVREALFIEFAEKVKTTTKIPLMLTGGFRTLKGMNEALSSQAVDLIGMARPFCVEPELPRDLLQGRKTEGKYYDCKTGISFIDNQLEAAFTNVWHQEQICRMGKGLEPDMSLSPLWAGLPIALRTYGWDPQSTPLLTKSLQVAGIVLVGAGINYIMKRWIQ